MVITETALESVQAIQETRRLVEVESVHAIVGPIASGIAFSIVESVAADAGIPVITTGTSSEPQRRERQRLPLPEHFIRCSTGQGTCRIAGA